MACAGDKSATCGGSWALSLFVTGPASSILAALPTASNLGGAKTAIYQDGGCIPNPFPRPKPEDIL